MCNAKLDTLYEHSIFPSVEKPMVAVFYKPRIISLFIVPTEYEQNPRIIRI
jgi:hypothetical protein